MIYPLSLFTVLNDLGNNSNKTKRPDVQCSRHKNQKVKTNNLVEPSDENCRTGATIRATNFDFSPDNWGSKSLAQLFF